MATGSAMSTLSKMQRSTDRYEKYITLASVFLLITSTIVIFTSVVLIKWYFMPHLNFWDPMFVVAPYLMLALGIYKFIISLYGFVIACSENRGLFIFFAALLSIAFIAQVASIFVFWQVKTQVEIGSAGMAGANDELQKYGQNGMQSMTNSWDYMQHHLHCCGANGVQTGYMDWSNTPYARNKNSVPDSCCRKKTKGCGENMLIATGGASRIRQTIFVDGCLEILRQWMEEEVAPMIAVYSGVGVAISLVELITVVMISAYVSHISRRRKKKEMMYREMNEECRKMMNPGLGDVGDSKHEIIPMNTINRISNLPPPPPPPDL